MELYEKNNNLVNVGNSILKAYGCETYHPSLKELDKVFKKNDVPHKKVCFILLDGFGTHIQDVYKNQAPYIYAHAFHKITSVFPPTTVAATTALLTGEYPCQTGWMGWTEKLPMYETPVTMFPSTFIGGTEPTPRSTWDLFKPDYIVDKINAKGEYKAHRIMGFEDEAPGTDVFFTNIRISLKTNDFTYAYWTEPDSSLHGFGVESEEVGKVVEDLDNQVKKLTEAYKDVLFITLADHGHINCQYLSIYEHPDFYSCLRNKDYANEPRASVFYVKEDKLEEFRILGEKYYGKYFEILSKDEVKKNKVFGLGKKNRYFDDLIGDYLFIAKDKYCFSQDTTTPGLVSHHAGMTDDEKYINLGLYNQI